MRNENVELFLAAYEWAKKRGFVFFAHRGTCVFYMGFCDILSQYLQNTENFDPGLINKICARVMQDPAITKYKPLNTIGSFWFMPYKWEERKIIAEKIKKEYRQQKLGPVKKFVLWFLKGSERNPIPGYAFAVLFITLLATVLMLVNVVISLLP